MIVSGSKLIFKLADENNVPQNMDAKGPYKRVAFPKPLRHVSKVSFDVNDQPLTRITKTEYVRAAQ